MCSPPAIIPGQRPGMWITSESLAVSGRSADVNASATCLPPPARRGADGAATRRAFGHRRPSRRHARPSPNERPLSPGATPATVRDQPTTARVARPRRITADAARISSRPGRLRQHSRPSATRATAGVTRATARATRPSGGEQRVRGWTKQARRCVIHVNDWQSGRIHSDVENSGVIGDRTVARRSAASARRSSEPDTGIRPRVRHAGLGARRVEGSTRCVQRGAPHSRDRA